jgi:DNA-binding XRE family transcriptional regulator
MSWDSYRNDDRQEQEQLEIIRALIGEATKDTTLWLHDDPSEEERVHVFAIQTGLVDLSRIIERRMERRKLPKDEWEYSETVSEVLSRLDKAGKLRGNIIVGRGLGRLTERLPQELPGAKARSVTQALAPPHDWHEELRRARNMEDDFGFLTFGHAWDAVRMLAQANDPIDQEKRIDSLWRMYPEAAEKLGLPKLPASSLSHVKPAASSPVESQADRWLAFRNEFEQLAREEERIERAAQKDRLLRAYCDYNEHPEILHEKGKPEQGRFCLLKAPETGLWMLGDGVSENFLERFRALAARAGLDLGSPKGTDPEDSWLHQLYLDLCENNSKLLFLESSQRTNTILRVCVASATFCARLERKAVTGAERLRTDKKQAESSPVQNSANSAQGVESRSTNGATTIGRNIDTLRKECGWSLDKLAKETGIDKKSILSHVNKGVRPIPRILREYAQAFSKALERKIIAPDLEE